jgi:hypothetical protein
MIAANMGKYGPLPEDQQHHEAAAVPSTSAEIIKICDELKQMLLAKNRAYGDSALDPVRVFSRADTLEQINVRIDDKLSRIMRRGEGVVEDEDVELDLCGYFILRRIVKGRIKAKYRDIMGGGL